MSDEEGSKPGAAGELISRVLLDADWITENPRTGKAVWCNIEDRQLRHAPRLAKALRVAIHEIERCEQMCIWLYKDSYKYPGTDAGNAAKILGGDLEKALAEINAICAGEKPATRGEEEK